MKAKILNAMDEYLLSNPLLCRGRSKLQFFLTKKRKKKKGVLKGS